MPKLFITLMALFVIICFGMNFPVHAMEKAEADERTNPLAMEKAEEDERSNPLAMEKAEEDEHPNPLSMERRPNPVRAVNLKPGQQLPTQNGGTLSMQGKQILLVNRNGSKQLFPPGSTIVKQPDGHIGILGINRAVIWGTDGAARGPR